MGRVTDTWSDGKGYQSGYGVPGPYVIGNHNHKQVIRGDITHNLLLVNWRKPSGYFTYVTDIHGFTGTATGIYMGTKIGALSTSVTGGYAPQTAGDNSYLGNDSNTMNRVNVQALLKAKDQNIHVGNAIAESRKTVSMIGDRVMRLYKGYRLARKGKFGDAARELGVTHRRKGQGAANSWLELQYGWMPLLSDIHGGYQELTKDRKQSGHIIKVSKSATSTVVGTSNAGAYNKTVSTIDKRVKLIYWYRLESPGLAQASSVGLVDPLEIAWELTPWSFVVDWMIPVGDVISSLSATVGMQFLSGTVSSVNKGRHVSTWSNPTDIYGRGKATGIVNTFDFYRTVLLQPKMPAFYVKDPFSTAHFENAIALLRGLIKR